MKQSKYLTRIAIQLFVLFSLSACSRVFFYPSRQLALSPADMLLDFEDVYVQTPDELTLHGWFIPATGEEIGTIFFLHGNAENIANHLTSVAWLPSEGFNVFIFDYRGFGRSEGTTSIEGSLVDTEAAFSELLSREDIDQNKIIVFGQSLGASLAIYFAAHSENRGFVQAVVADSPFASYREILKEKVGQFWLSAPFRLPLSWTIPRQYDPVKAVSGLTPIPLLLIHGGNDRVIPAHHSEEIFEKAAEPKRLWLVPQASHIEALRLPSYRRKLIDFLRSRLAVVMAEKFSNNKRSS